MKAMLRALLWLAVLLALSPARAEPLPRERIEALVQPPLAVGEALNDQGVYALLNSGGARIGYVFETAPMAPLPGFGGAPIDMLVLLDNDARFLGVKLIEHNEPIFVSGLGEAPFRAFLEQYAGLSLSEPLVVGVPYGEQGGGSLTYLDGVTKATASVRIAHESILAAAREVARERMQGIATGPPAFPVMDHDEALDWDALVGTGIAHRLTVTNAEMQEHFAGTIFVSDDPGALAAPDEPYLDLWLVDLGPPAIARAALGPDSLDALARLYAINPDDEPILVIDTGRHGLVSEDFVRNTAPDLLSASQDGLPLALRDADLTVDLAPGAPQDYAAAMILRLDRRLGFDPSRPWTFTVEAQRRHGMLMPEIGRVSLPLEVATPERFFERPGATRTLAPWEAALLSRRADLAILGAGLVALFLTLGPGMNRLAGARHFTAIRLSVLAVVCGFVGWWGQGQLSIVTPLAALQAALSGGSFAFLLYDPFGLAVWIAALLGLVLWGRALFCGWLCPFGALQEVAHHLGRLLRLPRLEPSPAWDARLKWIKYAVLGALVAVAIWWPDHVDKAAEVEPFKTAITTFFFREWWYVAYAALWLLLGAVTFKGFCRYVCPLGALLAIGGLVRGRDWIARRAECGTPCQLCKVRCNYEAIARKGRIQYSECFGCLDCVRIHDDPRQCVPLVLAARKGQRPPDLRPSGQRPPRLAPAE